MSAAAPARLDPRTRTALIAMALAVFVIANDFTSLGVALPQVEHDLNAELSTVQWVVNAYTLIFGVLIVTGGRLADLFGRRRMFFVGIGIFAGFSAIAGFAPNAPTLIGARACMGIGAALIWPAVLGLIFSLVPPSRAGLAGGLLLGVSGLGNALGPMVGGLLADELSWRWILFANIPIAAIALTVVARSVARDAPATARERLDYAGVATLSVGLVALLLALDQSAAWGWGDPRVVGLLALSVVSLGAMVLFQLRAGAEALIPRDVVANRRFAAACLTTLLASGPWFVVLLYAPQFMEKILGYSALGSGVALLPLMLVFSGASLLGGRLYNTKGPRLPLMAGTVCIPVGTLLLSLPGEGASYAALVPALVVLGLGVGLFYSTLTTAALAALPPARTSVGGGLTFMFQLVGGAIGVGLTTTIFTGVADNHVAGTAAANGLSTADQHTVGQILAGTDSAHGLLARVPALAHELTDVARDAFVAGLHAGLRVGAAISLGAVAAAWLVVRPARPVALPVPEPVVAPLAASGGQT